MDVKALGPCPVLPQRTTCEIHLGAELQHDPAISDFPNIVLEPPNVCKDNRQSSKQKWRDFYAKANNMSCVSEDFIRVWPEHLTGGSLPSNPDHFMELHPMRSLTCGSSFSIDTRAQLRAHSDLGFKTAGQISTLARTFRLWIRRVPHPNSAALTTIEFDYFACTFVNNSEQCGFGKSGLHNFARLHVDTMNGTRRCSGGDQKGEPFRTTLGRARARSPSGYLSTRAQLTKLYAIDGTNFFNSLGACTGPDAATSEFDVLGIFTVDLLAVARPSTGSSRTGSTATGSKWHSQSRGSFSGKCSVTRRTRAERTRVHARSDPRSCRGRRGRSRQHSDRLPDR